MAGRGRLALLLYACLLPWPLSGWWVEADAGVVDGLTATGAESSWLWAALGVLVGLYGQAQDRAAVDPDIR